MLALQGAFALHLKMLRDLGARAVEVRTPPDLDAADALVIPGGESSTMSMQLQRAGLREPLEDRLAGGMPAFGTCAGAILLGREILDGRPDQQPFGAIDLVVRRNGYGRQVDSFEAEILLAGDPVPMEATFIRAPLIEAVGDGVEVLASIGGHPVVCAGSTILASTFHPELGTDTRLHERFLALVGSVDQQQR